VNLVFIHGLAASGKLTTARALGALTGYPVFHNHLVVDLLTTVFPFGSEPFVRLRERMWLDVFDDAARSGRSLIFTFAPESTVPEGFPARVRATVEKQGGRVCFAKLTVSDEEQERRITAASRREFHKLADLETLRRLRSQPWDVEEPPVDLEIDTDSSTAEASAELLVRHFDLKPEEPVQRFPG
jgi:hypothetical protein